MANNVKIIVTLKDARLYKKEDETIITGALQYATTLESNLSKLEGFAETDDSHLKRVITGKKGAGKDGEPETDYITVKTSYALPVGQNSSAGIERSSWSGQLVNADMRVKLSFKISEYKKKLFISAYPVAVVLPEDWEKHIINEFEGF